MNELKDPKFYAEHFLKIRDKKGNIVPLKFKPAQEKLYRVIAEEHAKGKGVYIVVLKGRQMGTSTMIEGIFFADSATTPEARTLIIAHDDESTGNLFEMNKLFYDLLPPALQPMQKKSNKQELVFENPTKDQKEKQNNPGFRSRIRCKTAGGKGAGRSFTFRNIHGSEVAFWPDFKRTHTAIMQTVPNDPDSCVVYETTANGMNAFKEFWDDAVAGRNGFRAVFLAWYDDPDYAMPVTPGTVWTKEETELMEHVGLTPEQLAWRRWCIAVNCGNDVDMFNQEYPTVPTQAFLMTGRPYFDNRHIEALLLSERKPLRRGWFEYDEEENGKPINIRWVDREDGFLSLWEDVQEGAPYVIGADNAGKGEDRFTMFAVENVNGYQVAEYENPVSEILFARQLWCLGKHLNWAMITMEVNYGSLAEYMLETWGYPNMYQRQRYDKIKNDYVQEYGWRTEPNNRMMILSNLRTVTDEHPDLLRSRALLEQMLHFQYDDNGKPQAVSGEHDDLVMAAAITHFTRSQMRSTVTERPEEPQKKLIEQFRQKGKRR